MRKMQKWLSVGLESSLALDRGGPWQDANCPIMTMVIMHDLDGAIGILR